MAKAAKKTTDVLGVFREFGAILTNDHFVYTSGRHGATYINKDAIYPHTQAVQSLCAAMARPFVNVGIQTVAGPTMGGIILAQWVAYFLSEACGRFVAACFAEEVDTPQGKGRYFGRGYEQYIRDQRVLVVEDIVTTGGSVRQVVEAVRGLGGVPVAVRALCNRGGVGHDAVGGVPLTSLCEVPAESWPASDCPLCQRGIPINKTVGKGK